MSWLETVLTYVLTFGLGVQVRHIYWLHWQQEETGDES